MKAPQHEQLTQHLVDTSEPPAQGQRFIRDTEVSGLALRITEAGSRAFVVEAWVNGRSRRKTLGKADKLSLKDARRLAKKEIGQFAAGRDLVAERKTEQVKKVPLKRVFEDYLWTHENLKPGTVRDYQRDMKEAFHDWQDKPIIDISRDMVERRHAQLGERSKARANNAMRVLRALLNFAADKYTDGEGKPLLVDNPTKRLSANRAWYRVERRQTVIKPHQLKSWFNAVLELKAEKPTGKPDVVKDYLFFLILTGLRREEAACLVWTDVDLEGRSFTVRDTKNKRDHSLPLSDYLLGLLGRRKIDAESNFVFPGESGRVVQPRYWMEKVTKASGVTFTIHDLRRTFITIAESLDIPAYALKMLLNHQSGADVTQGYIIADVERLRGPMQRITDRILDLAGYDR